MDNNLARRAQLYSLLGDLPERNRPLRSRVISCEEREHYVLEKLELDLNGEEVVSAYFAKPKNSDGPFPVMLYQHAHSGEYHVGKTEFISGRDGIQAPPYAEVFARRGWAGLCFDAWAFGERSTRSEADIFKLMLWHGRVMWGMMMYDSLRALDYLVSRSDVDANRIGTMGLSMGSTAAWWTAALDKRVKVCVDICCLTDFEALIANNNVKGHGLYYYVPALLKYFSTAEINALITPRPHLALAGDQDALTPVEGLERIDAALQAEYSAQGAPEAWKMLRYDTGHGETAEMRTEILAFLDKWL
jgi:dienelactone hydrolase